MIVLVCIPLSFQAEGGHVRDPDLAGKCGHSPGMARPIWRLPAIQASNIETMMSAGKGRQKAAAANPFTIGRRARIATNSRRKALTRK